MTVTVTASAATNYGLGLGGNNAYVTFGPAPGLGAATFTVEAWFRRDGAGMMASTGSSGVAAAIPLVTKGRGEQDGTTQDMNYFLGIDSASAVLVADFEEGAAGSTPGLNHPVYGVTTIQNNTWYHAAATYDGSRWRLFLNGSLESELIVNQPPRADSIQHAAIGSALTSTGAAAGFFNGLIDEVRIWNVARTAQQIAAGMSGEIASDPNLLGRWGLNETAGTVVNDSTGRGNTGTIVGTTWAWAPGRAVRHRSQQRAGRAGPHQSGRRGLGAVTRRAERVGVRRRRRPDDGDVSTVVRRASSRRTSRWWRFPIPSTTSTTRAVRPRSRPRRTGSSATARR